MHPIVVYINVFGKIIVNSCCIISDHLTHTTSAVHSFIKVVLDYIKVNYVNIKHVLYFSDVSQYKNYKNMINLCNHYNDFNLSAEWIFFAKSHGKSPCDGIGGTVKRCVDRASKQSLDSPINTPKLMYEYCNNNIVNISFYFLDIEYIINHINTYKLEERYNTCNKFSGIRSHHSFVPIDNFSFRMKHISNYSIYSEV